MLLPYKMPSNQILSAPPISPNCRSRNVLNRVLPNPADTVLRTNILQKMDQEPGFAQFFCDTVDQRRRLERARPMLIQEYYKGSPWRVLVIAYILGRTCSEDPAALLWDLFKLCPSPRFLIEASKPRLTSMLTEIGLCHLDVNILVDFSNAYRLHWPHISFVRSYVRQISGAQRQRDRILGSRRQRGLDVPTPLSQIRDIGKFMVDSYLVYCGEREEWRGVRSDDEDLTRFLQWKWATENKKFCPYTGELSVADEEYMEELIEELNVVYDTY
ncbi:hypothetical protein FA95DRAFT_1562573 [Auriscalpium vulgare]|uniref:Uncharacterized protein n=1 Tax=Auriscalpium vulgare TaxID=40419 RepID=A0ACB8RJL8_9AGAM|nr:hypothetical protein FA95DRAFT_1562573 [Auriscalpium vulgare]